ncbi:MAG: TonB-dependent receptor [Hyphomonadaceae bacterium]|jgi:iron complex outermembrane receptor protein|uniref:TonB-dependent receptor plug domain-containing protein n=1 Tax=Henriciella sp. TaxID=1968823 RepID=UPI000C0F82D2|nr:TonB-dependent receptor [Henriciella sp.]MBF34130.1 TonB-dependent receptor [Hyphomonadaceae bacterium]PHR77075.1 MAG: TonB-dependent receptor [Henriciella sp.]|tara:strand:+ start:1040 stop:3451 length:2412 start_codon:yes stop_codon:yes gene_type:complete
MFRTTCKAALLLATTSCLTLGYAAHAQQSENTNEAAGDESLVADTVIVTGTRQAQRTVFSSLAPIDVVSGEAIESTSSEDLLDTVAQLVPSFKVQRLPMADGNIFVRPATLRGLGRNHTLVLVNGKRRHRSALLGAGTDLASIPSFAIKRIEVLRDGASAQYGSDAIAGVINIILDDEPGYAAYGQFSQYYEGDGTNYQAGAQAGWELGLGGHLVTTLEYYDAERTSRSRQRPDAIELQANNPDLDVPNPVQHWGQPDRSATRFAFDTGYDFNPFVSGYAFGTYNQGQGVSDFNWRNPTSGVFNTSDVFPDWDLADIYPAGFSPRFGQEDEDLALAAGLKGELAEGQFTWDLSVNHGRNTIEYFMYNSINASLGPNSPTSFDIGTLEQRETNINADFVYLADLGLSSPVNVAFGAERREEIYEIGAGEEASWAIGPGAADGLPTGSNGFRGFEPRQAGEFDQESYAAYIDIEAPLTEAWTVGGALRFEDYSEFGDTTTGKLSTRYEITPELAVRATASTGFRAPTPGELFSESTGQGLDTKTLEVFTNGRFSPEGPVAAIIAKREGVTLTSLEPEESESYTLGLAYQNDAGFSGSIDLYKVEISDAIGSSGGFTLTAQERQALRDAGVPGGGTFSSVSFFQNRDGNEVQGVDVVGSYRMGLSSGDLNLTGAYNYNERKSTSDSADEDRRYERQLPQHTANLTATYITGAFEVFGRVRYYGEWTDFSDNADGQIYQDFGAKAFVDIGLTYNVTDNYSVRVGAENVFDEYPDEATYQANRGLIYSRNAPYDTDGGNYYIRLDAKF